MKKFLTSMLLLLVGAFTMTAHAGIYELTVAGVQVTDDNKNAITGAGISGTVTYDPSSKTLKLKNATITSTSWALFNGSGGSAVGIDGLTIELEGTNKLSSSGTYSTTYTRLPLKIKSAANQTGYLTVENTCSSNVTAAMYFEDKASFSVTACNLTVKAAHGPAVRGSNSSTNYFSANYTWFIFEGSTYALQGFSGYYPASNGIDNTVFVTENAKFDSSKKTFVNTNGTTLAKVVAAPALAIGGVAKNASYEFEITGEAASKVGITTGGITYAHPDRTLKLHSVVMSGTEEAIESYLPNLRIETEGECKLKAYMPCVQLHADASFVGDGKLYLTSTMYSAINPTHNAKVTMQTTRVECDGNTYGFQSGGGLVLKTLSGGQSVYRFMGGDCNVLANYITMDDIDIWTVKSYFNESDHKMYYDGDVATRSNSYNSAGTYFASRSYFTYYDLKVGGLEINNQNCKQIHAPMLVSGSAEYDNETKTLTLNNAVITAPSGTSDEAVRSGIDGLTVKAVGFNKINTEGDCFYAKAPMTFIGDGKLEATSTKGTGLSVEGNNKVTVKVDNEVYFTGAQYGYWGHHDDETRPDCDLILTKAGDNSDYYFRGTEASVTKASHIVCDGMDYFYNSSYGTPGCYFDEASHYVKQNGGVIVKGTDVNYYKVDTHYGIMVGGTEITNCNRRAIGSPYINKPLGVSYDDNSNTLTLDDVTINYTGTTDNNYDIKLSHGKCKINVTGDNVLTGNAKLFSPLWLEWDSEVELAGDGTLKLGTAYGNGYGLYLYQSAATIGGSVTLDATEVAHGIGSNASSLDNFGKLTVKGNAHVKAKTIENVSSFTLEDGLAITEPAGAQYKDNAVRVGDNIAQNIVIEKFTGIAIDATNFPDANFRAWLLNSENINGFGADAVLAPTEIAGIKEINVKEQGIANLKGIEFFTALESLNASKNVLTSIDVSNNTALALLDLSHNQLTSIDVSNNTALTTLYLNDNELTSIDVSNNTALSILNLYDNLLASLDVSKNTALNDLDCGSNQLTTLDVSKNTMLARLLCDANKLTSINVTMLPYLTTFYCAYNDLNTIDVSKNTALTFLACHFTKLSTLDVSKNTELTDLLCGGNQLTSLDISKNQHLRNLSIYSNLIAETEMGKIVAQLPTAIEGNFTPVNLSDSEEKNVITTKQVADAKAKGWNVYALVDGSLTPYDGYDAINGIDEAKTNVTDIYDAAGRKLDQTRRGINIVRTADGKTQKVLKR